MSLVDLWLTPNLERIHAEPSDQFHVTQFVTKCDELVENIQNRGKLPIIVGKGIITDYESS